MSQSIKTDILIIGAGVAGLWLNVALRNLGYSTILLEKNSIGGKQTIHSQGIIHGGSKYALNGVLSKASESISKMPKIWESCLNGTGSIDLSKVQLLSEAQYLWLEKKTTSKLTGFFASKALRGRIEKVSNVDIPKNLQKNNFSGILYKLFEQVVDIPSLIDELVYLSGNSIFTYDQIHPNFNNNILEYYQINNIKITAQKIIFNSGKGNEELLTNAKLSSPKMQTRPLHMVLVSSHHLFPLYTHYIENPASKPKFTITTHYLKNKQPIWYIGGEIAESEGVKRSKDEQIKYTQALLNKLFPFINLNNAQWNTVRIDRAEPSQKFFTRPDNAYISEKNNIITGWPTKLALTPDPMQIEFYF